MAHRHKNRHKSRHRTHVIKPESLPIRVTDQASLAISAAASSLSRSAELIADSPGAVLLPDVNLSEVGI